MTVLCMDSRYEFVPITQLGSNLPIETIKRYNLEDLLSKVNG